MRTPDDAGLVAAWAAAQDAAADRRGGAAMRARVTQLLAALTPAAPEDGWPVVDHDARLVELAGIGRGDRPLDGAATCPACEQQLDVTVAVPPVPPRAAGTVPTATLAVAGHALTVRAPTVDDLDAALTAAVPDPVAVLLDRVVTDVHRRHGDPVERAVLLERSEVRSLVDRAVVDLLGDALLDDIELSCPECGHRWRAWLDLERFAWQAVDDAARALLDEVHALALSYGWTPDAVLGLPRAVRQRHLELTA